MRILHVDPAVLRGAASAVELVLPALRVPELDPEALAALATVPGGAALVAEHDRLAAAVGRTLLELVDLAAGLSAVAAGVEVADHQAVGAFRDVRR